MDPIEQRVRAVVAALDAPAEVIDIDPALADTADFVAAYGYSLEDSANCIVVVGKGDPPVHAACIVLAHTRLDVNRAVRKRLGVRRASFAPADVTRELTDMQIGGVTPFALPPTMPLWIDSRVMARETIVLGGGSRSCKVVAAPSVLTALPNAQVVTDLAQPPG
jgi:prolyl-tRNA editing enzyme YbaK/EbsC (Cys-tRNA(Pro) deacylase)